MGRTRRRRRRRRRTTRVARGVLVLAALAALWAALLALALALAALLPRPCATCPWRQRAAAGTLSSPSSWTLPLSAQRAT
jgi:hypothetical protein